MTEFTTPEWVKDAIFYQIFPDRFAKSEAVPEPSNLEPWHSSPTIHGFKGGDLLGVAEHLDYLQALGITAIYFNPIFQSAANHRYSTHDYYQVDSILGGNDSFRALLDAAHARGIRVVLDGVFNHAGRGFYQFHHTLENGAVSPYLDWFHFDEERLRAGKRLNAYPDLEEEQRILGSQRSLEALGYQAWWDAPALPKFNINTPAVRRFILDVARHWIEFGIIGWRLDVPNEVDDAFWREFRVVVKTANPEAYIVGEIWSDARRWLQGDQFDAVMNYLFTKACIGFFVGDRLDGELVAGMGYGPIPTLDAQAFARQIEELLALYPWEVTLAQLNLLDSHDTARFLTLAGGDISALKLAILFQMTYPGAPCIYYGDEIGLEGGRDPDCRRAMPWDETQWNTDLLAYYRRLIALRKAHPALRRGEYVCLHAHKGVYAFLRRLEDEVLVIVLNNGEEAYPLDLPLGDHLPDGVVLHDLVGGGEGGVTNGLLRGLSVGPRMGTVLSSS